MILFLRDQHDQTIVDIEFWQTTRDDGTPSMDISVLIDIKPYSEFLLISYLDLLGKQELNVDQRYDKVFDLIKDFEDLQNVEGWLHQEYIMNEKQITDEDYYFVLKILRERLKNIAQKYELTYVED